MAPSHGAKGLANASLLLLPSVAPEAVQQQRHVCLELCPAQQAALAPRVPAGCKGAGKCLVTRKLGSNARAAR